MAQPIATLVPTPSAGRVPPQNLEAERSLLGAMLLSRDATAEAIESCSANDFYKPLHGRIFESIAGLYGAGEPVDAVTLAEALRKSGSLEELGGQAYLRSLTAETPSITNAAFYAEIVSDTAVLRRLIARAGEIADAAYRSDAEPREVLTEAEGVIFALSQARDNGGLISVRSLLEETLASLEALSAAGGGVTGVTTGFADFDRLTAGLQPSNLMIVAARPGMGKSTFIANVAAHIAIAENAPAAFFTLEMSKSEVVNRLLCSEGRVEAENLKTGRLSDSDWAKVATTMGVLSEAPIYIDDSAQTTVLDVRSKCQRLLRKEGRLGVIVIDYIQLMHGPRGAESRQVEVSEISRGLKILARDLNTPIIAACQLNRSPESRADKRPMLGDLRESGSLEQDSDIVAFLYRDDYYHTDSGAKGEAELIVAKHRNGPTDTIRLAFLQHHSRFANFTSMS